MPMVLAPADTAVRGCKCQQTSGRSGPCVCSASRCRERGCARECVSTSKDQAWKAGLSLFLWLRQEKSAIGGTRGVIPAARELVRSEGV